MKFEIDLYSIDVGGSDKQPQYGLGDTVRVAGGITADIAINNIQITINVRNATTDALIRQLFDDNTIDLLPDVKKTFTAMNSGVEIDYGNSAAGTYYLECIATGGLPTAIDETRSNWGFVVSDEATEVVAVDQGLALTMRHFMNHRGAKLCTWYTRVSGKPDPAFNMITDSGVDTDYQKNVYIRVADQPSFWQLQGKVRILLDQGSGGQRVIDFGEVVSESKKAYCAIAYDIKRGDRIIAPNNNEYIVLHSEPNYWATPYIRELELKWLP